MKVKTIIIWNGLMALVLLAAVFIGLTSSVVYDVYNPTHTQITSGFQIHEHFNAWTGTWVLDKKVPFHPDQYEEYSVQKISLNHMSASASQPKAMSYWDTFKPENKALRTAYWESISNQVAYYFIMYLKLTPWIPLVFFMIGLSLCVDRWIQIRK